MPNSFFQELLQRKVFRGIAIYVFVAWLVMQAAEIVLQAFVLPEWTLRFIIISLVLGLPVVAVLSWIFDVTPRGVRRESTKDREANRISTFGRGVDFLIIAVLAVAVGVLGWKLFTGSSLIPEAAAREPSIAVLPFVNMSDDEANEYFSDGISEELLNALAKVEGLKVAGRTSSFFYKGKDQDLRRIGQELGVATVLEGSVRKAADRVRVTAQLVDTADGFHLWSDTFDYELDDVFEIQDEIAQAVVKALKGQLLGEDLAATTTTQVTNSFCYTAYLQGREELHRRREQSIVRAEALFREAVEADPGYAPAWVGLAESYMLQHINHQLLTLEEAESKAEDAIRRALSLNDASSEAYAALGLMRMQGNRMDEAEAAFSRSLALNPNYPEALHWYGLLHKNRGERERAFEKLSRSVELDPLHPVARSNFGQILLDRGEFDRAKTFFERSVALDPEFATNYAFLAGIAALGPMCNPYDAAAQIDKAIGLEPDKADFRLYKVGGLLEMNDLDAAVASADEFATLLPHHPLAALAQFAVRLQRDGDDAAVSYLDGMIKSNPQAYGKSVNLLTALVGLMQEDFAGALAAFEAFDPRFAGPEPMLDDSNFEFARLVALTHKELGHEERATYLLDAAEDGLASRSRFGPQGYQLADVEIALMRGDDDKALELLAKAFDEGFRNRTLNGLWRLRDYPLFDSIRDRSEFRRVVERIEQYHAGLAAAQT